MKSCYGWSGQRVELPLCRTGNCRPQWLLKDYANLWVLNEAHMHTVPCHLTQRWGGPSGAVLVGCGKGHILLLLHGVVVSALPVGCNDDDKHKAGRGAASVSKHSPPCSSFEFRPGVKFQPVFIRTSDDDGCGSEWMEGRRRRSGCTICWISNEEKKVVEEWKIEGIGIIVGRRDDLRQPGCIFLRREGWSELKAAEGVASLCTVLKIFTWGGQTLHGRWCWKESQAFCAPRAPVEEPVPVWENSVSLECLISRNRSSDLVTPAILISLRV